MLSHTGTRVLETPRLVLRRFEEKDAEAMFAWAGDSQVTRFLRYATHKSVDDSRAVLRQWQECYRRPDFYEWAVTEKECSRTVGAIALNVLNEHDRSGDVGYCLLRECWGRGYMSEALSAVLEFGFHTVGFNRIEGTHSELNPASGAVMRRCGMQYEGLSRQLYYSNEGFQDCHRYARLKSD